MYYLDSNIFLYSALKNSPYHHSCIFFLQKIKESSLSVTTSCETIQEIIHVVSGLANRELGIRICRDLLKIIPEPLAIDLAVLPVYLQSAKKYQGVESRDILHLAVCISNTIDTVITYDRHFQKFSEIKVLTPEDIL